MTAFEDPRPGVLRVAVIGSGPSGLYAAEALSEQGGDSVLVDVIDRLPTPFGLVRYGVAPDHLKIKSMLATLHATFDRPNVRFLGRLGLGAEISAADLQQHYHAVVYATGAQSDRRLGIPGEDLPGSHSATEFVSWYNGHPLGERTFDLSRTESVAVIGAGNVALDVARLLAKRADELRTTDVPDEVLNALHHSAVRDIHIIARRGPVQAKFSTKELRELGELDNARVHVSSAELPSADEDLSGLARAEKNNLKTFTDWADAATGTTAGADRASERRVEFHFWRAPSRITGADSCAMLELADTRGAAGAPLETLSAQLVIRAIGYRSLPLPGVPFDDLAGVVPHKAGRVLDADGQVRPGEYVAGWLKRGPTGVIGTNRSDANETVSSLLEDLAAGPHSERRPIEELLTALQLPYTEFDGWLRIDSAEREAGLTRGGPRVKITDWATLLELAERAELGER
ncbi:MAG: FAD-dependent pyridine nucleotide-disulfide oxidoreductase [Frankiales bacterium]|nr:FAD-dependent pyridine nucleotide-disulfide oxidoreductase [Frankiales bacterium]